MNKDGNMDLLSASKWDHKIRFFKNDALGNFVEMIISDTCWHVDILYPADIDNDNDVDLFLTL